MSKFDQGKYIAYDKLTANVAVVKDRYLWTGVPTDYNSL